MQPTDLVRLWLHESERVYRDKLTDDKDIEAFNKIQADIVKKSFDVSFRSVSLSLSPIRTTQTALNTPAIFLQSFKRVFPDTIAKRFVHLHEVLMGNTNIFQFVAHANNVRQCAQKKHIYEATIKNFVPGTFSWSFCKCTSLIN